MWRRSIGVSRFQHRLVALERWPASSRRCFAATSSGDAQPDADQEHGKMVSEGGGSVSSFQEAKEDAKRKTSKLDNIVEGVKQHAEMEMKTAKDMVKDIPEKARETSQEFKETVVIAGQSIVRDAEKLARKAGVVKSDK